MLTLYLIGFGLAQDKEKRDQEEIAEDFVKLGVPAVPVLITALKDNDRSVQSWAAGVLVEIGPATSDAVHALKNALQDPYASVRRAAAEALEKIEGKQDKIPPD